MAPSDWPSLRQPPDASGKAVPDAYRMLDAELRAAAVTAAPPVQQSSPDPPAPINLSEPADVVPTGEIEEAPQVLPAAKLLPRAPTVFVCADCSRRSRASWHAPFGTACIHWVELVPVACPEAVHSRRILRRPVVLLHAPFGGHHACVPPPGATCDGKGMFRSCCLGGIEDRAEEAASARASRRGGGRRAARCGLGLHQAPSALRGLRWACLTRADMRRTLAVKTERA
jgi:hypothetical protein